ncbi:MAG: acetyl-CoA C-acetyltransferase [bacterium]
MLNDRDAYIVSAARTPIGEFQKSLAGFSATDLGAIAVREAIARAKVDAETIDEVILGNVVGAGLGQAPARQAAIRGGVPGTAGCMTINKVCGSGLKSVMLAAQAIRAGDADAIVAGGMESMSNAPYLLPGARTGYRMGNGQMVDSMIHDGLWDSFGSVHMGSYAELTARRSKISREEQDQFALESHQKAARAQKDGKFRAETVAVEIPGKKGEKTLYENDERVRTDASLDGMAKLRPAFEKDGSVTAGNAPGLNDGAAALVILSGARAKQIGAKPLARVASYATGGGPPEEVFYAPIVAVKKLMARGNWKIGDFDLIEANEAFAVQALADGKELGWDWSRVNVNGGAVALGHPIGASGARILTTLIYALHDRKKTLGLATLCLGGGNAVALAVEAM